MVRSEHNSIERESPSQRGLRDGDVLHGWCLGSPTVQMFPKFSIFSNGYEVFTYYYERLEM